MRSPGVSMPYPTTDAGPRVQASHSPMERCRSDLQERFKLAGADGWTPLHQAAERGDLDAVTALVATRADVNARLKVLPSATGFDPNTLTAL